MNKLIIRLVGNLLYALLAPFQKKEFVLMDTCFDNVKTGNIGAVHNLLKNKVPIVIVKNKRYLKANDNCIAKESFKYYLYMAKSRLVVCNNAHHLYVAKSKNTTILDTWHGTPYKDVSIGRFGKKIMKLMHKNTDYHISGNKYFYDKYLKNTIGYSGEIIEKGFFRNDTLFDVDNKYTQYDFMNNKKKNILICPTWRDYGDSELFTKINSLISALEENFSDKYNVLLRYHNRSEEKVLVLKENYFDVSLDEFSIQELLKITDILISDYSSVIFDFALLERPIALYQYDQEFYKKERNLLIDDINLEFGINVFYTEDQIISYIKTIDFNIEKSIIKKFNNLINQTEYGNSLDIIRILLKGETL